jgi:hypothetical protein
MKAPDTPQDIQIVFEKGIPVKLVSEGKTITDSLELFIALNAIGKKHGIGRIDIVEVFELPSVRLHCHVLIALRIASSESRVEVNRIHIFKIYTCTMHIE